MLDVGKVIGQTRAGAAGFVGIPFPVLLIHLGLGRRYNRAFRLNSRVQGHQVLVGQ